MRAAAIALVLAASTALMPAANAERPHGFVGHADGTIRYAPGELCDQAVVYSYRLDSRGRTFVADGSPVRLLERVTARGSYVAVASGTEVTFETHLVTTVDLTVTDFTSDHFVYRGVWQLLRATDGRVLAARTGQLRINRFGDVTFQAGPAQVLDVCPFLA